MELRLSIDNDLEEIKYMWKYCFNDSDEFMNYYFNEKYKNNNTVVIKDDELLVSSLQLNQYNIKLNNKNYDVSYVVGVSTLAEARGRGYMKHIMNYSLNEMYKRNQMVSILMPIDYRLYRKYGYEHCYDQLEYEIDISSLSSFKSSGKLVNVNDENLYEMIDIYNECLKDSNGYTNRDKKYYDNLLKEVKCENGNIYLYKEDKYEGYIIYVIDSGKMIVRELLYNNINALKGMLRFIYNHNTQCSKVYISTPVNDKIRYVVNNLRDINVKIKPFMMGRVINVAKYLESLETKENKLFDINISITDEFITENNKVFKIENENFKLKVTETKEKEDIKLSINELTQLAFSYLDIEEIIYTNSDNTVSKDVINNIKCIFNKKNNYINEYV